ncbi:MAG: PEP-CTERM sorting domain-containing protein [Planctomycetes bacterium]|nr:PEP-CTERM sorting domain-containing protein [Planctomycetota bacterium]
MKSLIVALVLFISSTVQGAVIYVDVPDVSFVPLEVIRLDFSSPGWSKATANWDGDLNLYHHFWDDERTMIHRVGGGFGIVEGVDSNHAALLDLGDMIGAGSTYTTNQHVHIDDGSTGDWDGGGVGYIGFRMDAGRGNYNYGYLHLSHDDANNVTKLLDFGYETSVNTSIVAGLTPVPEPAAISLMFLGLTMGFLKRRRI